MTPAVLVLVFPNILMPPVPAAMPVIFILAIMIAVVVPVNNYDLFTKMIPVAGITNPVIVEPPVSIRII